MKPYLFASARLALLVPGVASAQQAPTGEKSYLQQSVPAPSNAFELTIGTGYTQGFGNVQSGVSMPDVAASCTLASMRNAWVGVGIAVVVIACGSSDASAPAQKCTPGQSVACVGTGGCAGGQSCAADGSGFGACVCGSGGDAGGGGDAGAGNDAGSDAALDTAPTYTTGHACASDASCTGPGEKCSSGAFGVDTVDPTPTCVGLGCAAGASCNGDTGTCVALSGAATACVGTCAFEGASSAAPRGCVGKDSCRYVRFTQDASGVHGVGACLGGCKADGDCTGGNVCQVETAECVATKTVFSKSVGSACTVGDTTCFCIVPAKGTASYCSSRCFVGGGACGTGFTCDAELPAKSAANAPLFTSVPSGIAGLCLKTCTADPDCTSVQGYCDDSAGLATKVCRPGTR